MPKCDFNKVAKQLYWNHTSARVFSCTFAEYFQNNFFDEHLWVAAFDSAITKYTTTASCTLLWTFYHDFLKNFSKA